MVLMPGFQSTRLATEGALEPFLFLYTDDSIQGNPETCNQSSMMLNYEVKNIYDEYENTVYEVKGQLAWGHCLKIFDSLGRELGMVKECVLTFLPKFEVYEGSQMIGSISKELTFLKPRYNIDFNVYYA